MLGIDRAVLQVVVGTLHEDGPHHLDVQGVCEEHRRNGAAVRGACDGHDRDDLRRDGASRMRLAFRTTRPSVQSDRWWKGLRTCLDCWVGHTLVRHGNNHHFDGLTILSPFPALQKAEIPVIFLLSVGADPTESIEVLARRKKVNFAIDRFFSRVPGVKSVFRLDYSSCCVAQGYLVRTIFLLSLMTHDLTHPR